MGAKILPGHSLHGEKRNESHENNQRGEKSTGLAASLTPSTMSCSDFLAFHAPGDLAVDAFQHDDGGIDENAEVDGADGNQVCRVIR